MTEVLSNILTSSVKDGKRQYLDFFGMYFQGEVPYWELTCLGKKLKIIPSPDHIFEDALWQLFDMLAMDPERLMSLPADLDPINMPEDYGPEYCAEKREGLEEFFKITDLNFTLVTYSGMDMVQAARLTERMQAAGIKIIYFGIGEKFMLDLTKIGQ